MDMFSLIAEQVRNKQELFDNEGKIMESLLNNGYRLQDADAALTLIQSLVQKEIDDFPELEYTHGSLITRNMTMEERERFTMDAFGFVLKLTRLGIIDDDQRDEVFENAMNLFAGRIDLDCIKMLIALILFDSSRDRGRTVSTGSRRIKKNAWN